jgi:hypothetical protein
MVVYSLLVFSAIVFHGTASLQIRIESRRRFEFGLQGAIPNNNRATLSDYSNKIFVRGLFREMRHWLNYTRTTAACFLLYWKPWNPSLIRRRGPDSTRHEAVTIK